jgi:hypothetical protein
MSAYQRMKGLPDGPSMRPTSPSACMAQLNSVRGSP